MVRTIPAQFVRKCMLFSSCVTLRKRRQIIYSNIHFYFLITYGVCKKRKYCNRMSEKKNSLLLTNVGTYQYCYKFWL